MKIKALKTEEHRSFKTCGFYVYITLSGLWKIAVGEIPLRGVAKIQRIFDGWL